MQINSLRELELIFDNLSFIGKNEYGLQRLAFSDFENQAHHFIKDKLAELEIETREDSFGNLFARISGKDNTLPAVATGSHLDTVPNGGAYDGAVGVISGLYALSQLKNKALRHPIEMIAFRAEESSRFGFSCMGSKLMTGCADFEKWRKHRDHEGNNIFDVLMKQGVQAEQLNDVEIKSSDYKAFVEIHTEQGRVLEESGISVGVVSAIAAPTRFLIEIDGQADHSGATPMGQRHDALVSAASIITLVNEVASREARYGTVGTVGHMEVSPNAMNVIPGKVVMNVDIRGINEESIRRVVTELKEFISSIKNVNVTETCMSEEKPTPLNNDIATVLAESCSELSISHRIMQSGAGHDAMYMAKKMPTAMLFAPSVNGISHNPEEYTDFNDIWNCARVLTHALEQLAK